MLIWFFIEIATMSSPDNLKATVSTLPDSPGVYRYYNEDGLLIYVGKAKSLKKRVSSYFNKQSQYNRKTEKLVSEIVKIEFTLANTEFDALLMENNFIKENQPKYNILLKDDKTFPYLCILKERFPRIISTRKYIPKQGEYFGPYSSVVSMNSVLDWPVSCTRSGHVHCCCPRTIFSRKNLKFALSSTLGIAKDRVKGGKMKKVTWRKLLKPETF